MMLYPSARAKTARIKQFVMDESGSEAVEMVASMAFLCILVMSVLMILTYAIQVNQVAYAAKRISRGIEITGLARQSELNEDLKKFVHNADKLSLRISVPTPSGGWFNGETGKIQLRQSFKVNIDGSYPLVLANPGFASGGSVNAMKIALPLGIHVTVEGQVEHYWKRT